MKNYINVISKDFKIAKHEYDKDNNIIGAQCSERKYPDEIILDMPCFYKTVIEGLGKLKCLKDI